MSSVTMRRPYRTRRAAEGRRSCAQGGEAKALIAASALEVNGVVELRRGRKSGDGDVVDLKGGRVRVAAQANVPDTSRGKRPSSDRASP